MVRPIVIFFLFVVFFCQAQENDKSRVQIQSSLGDMTFELFDETPIHKAAFLKGIASGLWENQTFNRVVKNFVIQGGCPDTLEGFTDETLLIPAEINSKYSHVYGMLGFGRDDNPEKKSAICQLYIVNTSKIPHLDGNYSLFGKLVEGQEVLNEISKRKVDDRDQPLNEISFRVVVLK